MSTGMKDSFVRKGITWWYRGMWGAEREDGTGIITVWAICTNGETEMPWDATLGRSRLLMRLQPGDKDWPRDSEGVKLIDRCRRARASGRPMEVICREGDRALDFSRKNYIDPRYYAVRITLVGCLEKSVLGTIKGDFMTEPEYEAWLKESGLSGGAE